MSPAQRRAALECINTISSPIPQDANVESIDGTVEPNTAINENTAETAVSSPASVPVKDEKEVQHALRYNTFTQAGPPQLHRYESFPPMLSENVAEYKISTVRRIGQVTFAILACVLASGIVCGFAALKPVLIAEGVYASLCPPSSSSSSSSSSSPSIQSQIPCPEQDMRLNLLFITASITLNISTVLAGYVLDKHGRRACYLLSALALFLGGTCMAAAFHYSEAPSPPPPPQQQQWPIELDGFLTGNVLLGLGGTFLFVSSYQLSHALPRHAGLVIALITGAFDASAAIFLFYRLAYQASAGRFPPATFFLLFALVIPALLLLAEFSLMSEPAYYCYYSPPTTTTTRRERDHQVPITASHTRCPDRAQGLWPPSRTAAAAVRAQMASPWFVLLLLATVAQMTRMNYFIATVRAQYRFLLGGDEQAAERVNGVFDVALPVAGVVTTPFIGLLLNRMPVWGTLAVLTGLVTLLGVLNCVPGSEAAAYATVVAFVLYRPLYYSAISDYATKVFGVANFGRIYGTVICVSGLGQVIQPTLDALTHGPLHKNPIPLNAAFAISGSLITATLTRFVYIKTRQEQAGTQDERKRLLGVGWRDGEYARV